MIWDYLLSNCDQSPTVLLQGLLFSCSLVFGLRAGRELYNFGLHNIELEQLENDYFAITYTETASKNYQPGLRNINKPKKVVTHYDISSNPRSFLFWLNKYLQRCPASVKDGSSNFWQHPLRIGKISEKDVWFSKKNRCGIHFFGKTMKQCFEQAGLHDKDLTLRSIRSTLVITLTEKQFDDSAIQLRTGHKSKPAVEQYKRPQLRKTQQKISAVLTGQVAYSKRQRNKMFLFTFFCTIVSVALGWMIINMS